MSNKLFTAHEIGVFCNNYQTTTYVRRFFTPEELGFVVQEQLKGEAVGNEEAPVLFKIYSRDNEREMIVASDHLLTALETCTALTKNNNGMSKAQLWAGVIALCSKDLELNVSGSDAHETKDTVKILEEIRLHSLGAQVLEIIKEDLAVFGKAGLNQDKQGFAAKTAGQDYQSGFHHYLTFMGERLSRGSKDGTTPQVSKELTAHLRCTQFVCAYKMLPTQEWLRKQLESEGLKYSAGRSRELSKWKDLFSRVGLDSLPKE